MEEGNLHLEWGWLLAVEGDLERAGEEFETALEIFSGSNLSVESGLALLALAGIDCQGGDQTAALGKMEAFQEIARSLGTLKPFIPTLAAEEPLLSCLEDHLEQDPLIAVLVREVKAFRSQLPALLETLAARKLPIEVTQRPNLEIQALGRMLVKKRGRVIDAPEWTKQRTVRELFFYLLSCPGGASRDEICLEFWPDSEPARLQKQFKNTIYKLRRAVSKEALLYDQTSRMYSFNRSLDYRYDVEEFERALDLAKEEKEPQKQAALLGKAAELYQDPFAPEAEGTWAESLRYQLYLDFEWVSLEAAKGQLAAGNPEACLVWVEKLLSAAPAQEEAWRMALRAYGAKSDRAGVERTYQRCCQALVEELDAEPSPETESLYQELMS
jgi:DNA-binding SARP family transcriptional activator